MRFGFIYGRSNPDRTIGDHFNDARHDDGLDDTCQSNAYIGRYYTSRAHS